MKHSKTGQISSGLGLGSLALFASPFAGFGVFAVVMAVQEMRAGNLWLKATNVIIDADGLTLRKSWLFFRSQRRLAPNDVREIKTSIGMTSGQVAYYDLKIARKGGKDITAASAIRNKREAEWLAQEMNAALKGGRP